MNSGKSMTDFFTERKVIAMGKRTGRWVVLSDDPNFFVYDQEQYNLPAIMFDCRELDRSDGGRWDREVC